ncbi:MAG: DUF4965 domain-containing protein [Pirellulaceae bacterium]|nr:DUF4965 domain-containing protein [Planctomycetales bacterium]
MSRMHHHLSGRMAISAMMLTVVVRVVLGAESFRPPAVPLVACDPYFSIWSTVDNLTGSDTQHWTGKPHRLRSLVSVDGRTLRIVGADPVDLPVMPQTECVVQPTQTIYTFEGQGVRLKMVFVTPALPDDIDLLSRPVTYVVFEAMSTDGKAHDIQWYVDASGELAVNEGDQKVTAQRHEFGELAAVQLGSANQAILAKKGDDIRIDWGYLYLAGAKQEVSGICTADRKSLDAGLKSAGPMIVKSVPPMDRESAGKDVCVALAMDCGRVESRPVVKKVLLAYDDLYSIQYMKKNLRPYWRRNGWEAIDLLESSFREFDELRKRCQVFDEELMRDCTQVGGEQYAAICSLAYRQCLAAGKFVADDNGQPLQFCKENHSNGCIGTSDVFYPMAPQFLLLGPSLAKSFVVPFMNYAASARWKFPFAPHDLGTYPHANGQVYGGGERSEQNQMPVEESGNMLLLMGAIAEMEGHADFASLYWPQLTQWAEYLKQKGFDPENQLCTDDFAGHLAHNVNLSAKAICGLGAYAKLCALRGDAQQSDEYFRLARTFAERWVKEADSGDHFRLAFDKPDTWSQKYNLVWDRILKLDLFPDSVRRTEVDYYKRVQNEFGLPLDNRSDYTKLDWVLWTATLIQDRNDFQAIVAPVYKFLDETADRSPMTDWYFTSTAKKRGFTARPVVGGVFLQFLYDKPRWNKYAGRDRTKAAGWAPMPVPPKTVTLVPTSQSEPASWSYRTERPSDDWYVEKVDRQADWKTGEAGFGTRQTPGAVVRTVWDSPDIWIRRIVDVHEVPDRVAIRWHHDEDAEVYINGKLVLSRGGYTTDYEIDEFDPSALKKGANVIAIHCHQTSGGQYIDAGLDAIVPVSAIDSK